MQTTGDRCMVEYEAVEIGYIQFYPLDGGIFNCTGAGGLSSYESSSME